MIPGWTEPVLDRLIGRIRERPRRGLAGPVRLGKGLERWGLTSRTAGTRQETEQGLRIERGRIVLVRSRIRRTSPAHPRAMGRHPSDRAGPGSCPSARPTGGGSPRRLRRLHCRRRPTMTRRVAGSHRGRTRPRRRRPPAGPARIPGIPRPRSGARSGATPGPVRHDRSASAASASPFSPSRRVSSTEVGIGRAATSVATFCQTPASASRRSASDAPSQGVETEASSRSLALDFLGPRTSPRRSRTPRTDRTDGEAGAGPCSRIQDKWRSFGRTETRADRPADGVRNRIGGGQSLPGLARLLQGPDEGAGLGGPLLGLMGHLGDSLHGAHQILRGQDLIPGRAGDPLDQAGRSLRDLADPLQRATGLAEPLRFCLASGPVPRPGPGCSPGRRTGWPRRAC